jgi:D-xylonolactonase
MIVEPVVSCACVLGEGPVWHPAEKRLYWLDIRRGRVLAYDPSANDSTIIYEGEKVGGMTVQADGSLLLLGSQGGIACMRGGKVHRLPPIKDSYEQGRRFNDAVADPAGRVYAGTMSEGDKTGRLYRIDPDGTTCPVWHDVLTSNGMAFTPDCRQLYHTETRAWKIHLFDYDQPTGTLSNRRTFTDIPRDEKEGMADGLALDEEGYIWSARFGGGVVVRYAPNGLEVARVQIPARKVTSVAFGGETLEDLYLTTAGGDDRSADRLAGALFRARVGVRGAPRYMSRVCL